VRISNAGGGAAAARRARRPASDDAHGVERRTVGGGGTAAHRRTRSWARWIDGGVAVPRGRHRKRKDEQRKSVGVCLVGEKVWVKIL